MSELQQAQLNECERERLANSGLIQPQGALLFIDKKSGLIRYASANSADWLGMEPSELLEQDGHQWLDENLPELDTLPRNAGKRVQLSNALDLGCGELDLVISPNSAGWLLEFEPAIDATEDLERYRLQRPPAPIDAAKLEQLQQALVDSIRALTGYERVMLYRFRPDWSGVVIAESVVAGKGTYFGLRFPASDIPAIARNLYAQTPYRHIPDSALEPIEILGHADAGSALDLTWADLRSVSPVHREYLRNMGVRSSFSVSIMVEGKLWGLIACHHPAPLSISLAARLRCKALAEEYVESLDAFRKTAQRGIHEQLSGILAGIRQSVDQGEPLASALTAGFPALAELFAASSGALFVGDNLTALGEVLDDATLQRLHQWLLLNQPEPVVALDHLPDSLTGALAIAPSQLCGLLAISLRSQRLGDALLNLYLLRPEEITEVAWAGNPEKPMEATGDGQRLSPRNSFEKWVEVRNGFSRPWDDNNLFAAQQLREQLMAWL
ncbi:GAF domain-containing protein [Halochromatium roseum]|uniref:GAF domain-containing protein n=1 Tax=Halochromatium roseum TaxID=391920 RepID=UPI0019130EE1|nr:GAF domain-containing protein [Halochromatium roseum]MBK5938232.1 hypothetical protein [Halochromatium roseum]